MQVTTLTLAELNPDLYWDANDHLFFHGDYIDTRKLLSSKNALYGALHTARAYLGDVLDATLKRRFGADYCLRLDKAPACADEAFQWGVVHPRFTGSSSEAQWQITYFVHDKQLAMDIPGGHTLRHTRAGAIHEAITEYRFRYRVEVVYPETFVTHTISQGA